MCLDKVAVLLATSNPNAFIIEQIDSFKHQKNVSIRVYWGDYDSPKEIKEFVRRLLEPLEFIEIEIHQPGPANNFFSLLALAEEDFIAFSDQDDIWLPNKLESQVNLLRSEKRLPQLAHSSPIVTKNATKSYKRKVCRSHNFFNLATRNCCQGCTIMINQEAKQVILSTLPKSIEWHDWWIALVVSLTGQIHFSGENEVIYRVHSSNLVGIPNLMTRIMRFIQRPEGYVSKEIEPLLPILEQKKFIDKKRLIILTKLISHKRIERIIAARNLKRSEIKFQWSLIECLFWILKRP